MASPRRAWQRRAAEAAPFALAALPAAVLTVWSLAQARQVATPWGDLAVLQLRTDAAIRFHELLGPYSRFGWDHPGPVAFYWSAPFSLLGDRRPGGLAAAAAAANLGWVLLIVAAARRARGALGAWLAAAVLLGFAALLGVPWLRQAWNPFLVVLPVAAAAVCFAAVSPRARWPLPAGVVAATWAVQTHVGSAGPLLAVTAVTLAPTAWRQRADWRSWRPTLAVTAAVSLVLWLPPLVEQVTHDPGNARTLVRFFRASGGTGHPIGAVARLVAPQLTLTSRDLGSHLGSDAAHFRAVGAGEVVVLLALGAVLAAGAWRNRRADDRFVTNVCAAGLAGSVASVVVTRAAAGDLLPYFTSFASGLGVVVWLGVLLTAAAEVARLRAAPSEATRRRAAGAAVALLAVAAVVLGVDAARARSFAAVSDHPEVARLAADALRGLPARPTAPVLVVVGANRPWPQAAGLAVELQRHGYRVRTTRRWVFLFGDAYRAHGDEGAGLLVLGASHGRWPAAPEGAVLLGQAGTARVWRLPAAAAARATAHP